MDCTNGRCSSKCIVNKEKSERNGKIIFLNELDKSKINFYRQNQKMKNALSLMISDKKEKIDKNKKNKLMINPHLNEIFYSKNEKTKGNHDIKNEKKNNENDSFDIKPKNILEYKIKYEINKDNIPSFGEKNYTSLNEKSVLDIESKIKNQKK